MISESFIDEIQSLLDEKVGSDAHGMFVTGKGFLAKISDSSGKRDDAICDAASLIDILEGLPDAIGAEALRAELSLYCATEIGYGDLVFQLKDVVLNNESEDAHELLGDLLERGAWLTSILVQKDGNPLAEIFYVDCDEIGRWATTDGSKTYRVVKTIFHSQFYPRAHEYLLEGGHCVFRQENVRVLVSRHHSAAGAAKAARYRELMDEGSQYVVGMMAELCGNVSQVS